MSTLVLLIVGPDRPGLVGLVSRVVTDENGTWEESRMARLSGLFAGIVKLDVPDASVPKLTSALAALREHGLEVTIHAGQEVSTAPMRRAILDVVGTDRRGIVHRIAHALADHSVNVEELDTEVSIAAMSGERLFRARAELSVPDNLELDTLCKSLESVAADLMVDIELRDSDDDVVVDEDEGGA